MTHPWETSASRLVSMTFWAPKVGSTKVTEKLVGQEPRFTRFRSCEMLEKFPEVCEKKSGLAVGVLWEMGDVCLGNWWRWKLSSDWAVSEMSRNESLLKLQY